MNVPVKNSDKIKAGTTLSLPRALADEEGKVSADMLMAIFTNRIKSASKKVKELVDTIQGKAFLTCTDSFHRLAGCIDKPEFRWKWYQQRKELKIGSFESILGLWLSNDFPQLDIHAAELVDFWEKRTKRLGLKEKLLPRLDKIDVLINFLDKNAKICPKETAIFAWSLLEGSENVAANSPEREIYLAFRPTLMDGLKASGLNEILAFLEPIAERLAIPGDKRNSEDKSSAEIEVEAHKENGIARDGRQPGNKLHSQPAMHFEIEMRLKELDPKVMLAHANHRKLENHLTDFPNDINKVAAAEHLGLEIQHFRDDLVLIEDAASEIISIVEQGLAGLLSEFNLQVAIPHVAEFSLNGYHAWKERTTEILRRIPDIIAGADRLKVFGFDITKEIIPQSLRVIELPDVCIALAELEGSAGALAAEKQAIDTFESLIASNHSNWEWCIFNDRSLLPEQWKYYGENLARNKGLSAELGICVRKEFQGLSRMLVSILEQDAEIFGESFFFNAFSCLEWLTLGQLESLEVESSKAQTSIMLFELNAAIVASQHNSTLAHHYWSAFPLRNALNRIDDEDTSALLQYLQSVCNLTIDAAWLVRELPIICREVLVSSDSSDFLEERRVWLKNEIDHCLMLQIGGGETYVELRTQAYENLFAPLRKVLDSEGISAFIDKYTQMRSALDLDESIRSWKSVLPDRMRKYNHYDKSIRQMMARKFDEIDRIIEAWRLQQNAEQIDRSKQQRHELTELVRGVVESPSAENQTMFAWFNELAKSGFRPLLCVASIGRTGDSGLDLAIENTSSINVFHPRSFSRKVAGQPVTHGDYLTDELMKVRGFNTVPSLAKLYVSRGVLEAYPELTATEGDEIPFELALEFEEQIEGVETKLKTRLGDIRKKLSAGGLLPAEIDGLLTKTTMALQNHLWTELTRELDVLEEISREQIIEAEAKREVCGIQEEITALGYTGPMPADLASLQEIWARLESELEPRRKHLVIFRNFRQLDSLRPWTLVALDEVLVNNDRYSCLPKPDDSAYLALVFENALVPLSEELRRCSSYVKEHQNFLQTLTDRLIKEISREDAMQVTSPIVKFLEATSDAWSELFKGQSAVEMLLGQLPADIDQDAENADLIATPLAVVVGESGRTEEWSEDVVWFARKYRALATPTENASRESFSSLVEKSDWTGARRASAAMLAAAQEGSSQYGEALLNCAVCEVKLSDNGLSVQEFATALGLIGKNPTNSLVQKMLPTKNSRGTLGDVVGEFLKLIAVNEGQEPSTFSPADSIIALSAEVMPNSSQGRTLRRAFAVSHRGEAVIAKAVWESLSGSSKQAEIRAAFLKLLWISSAKDALAYCFTLPPNDVDTKLAVGLAEVANQALEIGSRELLQSFVDLKQTVNSKPFQLFVDLMLQGLPSKKELPAKLSLCGAFLISEGLLKGRLRIEPRSADSPSSLIIALPRNGPFLFEEGKSKKIIEGPFIGGPTEVEVALQYDKRTKSGRFGFEVECETVSITGKKESFRSELDIQIESDLDFVPPSTAEIDQAFEDYPQFQVRGVDFTPRPKDERRIEKALFSSSTVRSIWISSPRRSGKTSMLFRIVDSFSVSQGRDNAIIFLTLDKAFESSQDFNRWVWSKANVGGANNGLREHVGSAFTRIGMELPFEADSGTFLSRFADALIATGKGIQRVIYLIDEVDKFASMYFAGGRQKETASEILWQIRNSLIAERKEVGVVFAGSSAARRLFVLAPDAPFFNSILALELTPFSCEDHSTECGSRGIVEPERIRGRFVLPKEALRHLLSVCAGIPYYMKLLSGATFAVAKQRHLNISNVNEGLAALLVKRTGSEQLDSIVDPGMDELRNLAIEERKMGTIAKAVLYTAAELGNPLSGRPLRRARMSAADSPLVAGYGLPKSAIEDGIDRCLDLGLLRHVAADSPELIFSIPILGEALRIGKGFFWSTVNHELEQISKSLVDEVA